MPSEAEEWRAVPGVPSCFASSRGSIRKHDKRLSLSSVESGHLVCTIWGRTRKAHQLVAAAFIGPRPEGLVVMHKNHIPWDNCPGNLSYGTVGENIHMDFVSGSRCHQGDKAPHRTLSRTDVAAIRASHLTNKELATTYGVSRPNISKVRNYITWTDVQNDVGSSLAGKPPTGETQMAKAPKTMTPAEKKSALADLKTATANHNANIKSISAALKESEKALATAKKSADAEIKAAEKAAEAARKAATVALAAVEKAHAAAVAKASKQQEASIKGTEKLEMKRAALEAMVVAAAPKAAKAKETESA